MTHQDEAALTRFEQLVQEQQPAREPWQPTSDYSYTARRDIEQPHAAIIRTAIDPAHVLDVGCGPNAVLVKCLTRLGVKATGVDLPGFDLTKPPIWSWLFANSYDLVICREVLEHLTVWQIAQAVRNLVKFSSRYVYVTTRFHPAPEHLLDVATHDDLDPTHISLTNQSFLRMLFVLEGCKRRLDLEQRLDWQHKGRVLVYEVPR